LANTLLGQPASFTCNGCHALDPSQGFFGTSTNQSFENLPQIVKIPHLRNMYDKIGMFGAPAVSFYSAADSGPMGNQVRGFGFTGDGGTDTMIRFLSATVFNPTSNSGFPQTNPEATRQDVEQFLLAFDSDLAPIVGQQVTLTRSNAAAAGPRISLLISRASTPFTSKLLGGQVMECDLVARVVRNRHTATYLYDPVAGNFMASDGTRITDSAMRAWAATVGQEITYTASTPGSGMRLLNSQ
jgi:hypothetical protein